MIPDQFTNFKFSRRGADIYPFMLDFSGHIARCHAAGAFEVWRKGGWRTWVGNGGCGRGYAPVLLMLVRIDREPDERLGHASIVEQVEPGTARRSRCEMARLISEANRRAS